MSLNTQSNNEVIKDLIPDKPIRAVPKRVITRQYPSTSAPSNAIIHDQKITFSINSMEFVSFKRAYVMLDLSYTQHATHEYLQGTLIKQIDVSFGMNGFRLPSAVDYNIIRGFYNQLDPTLKNKDQPDIMFRKQEKTDKEKFLDFFYSNYTDGTTNVTSANFGTSFFGKAAGTDFGTGAERAAAFNAYKALVDTSYQTAGSLLLPLLLQVPFLTEVDKHCMRLYGNQINITLQIAPLLECFYKTGTGTDTTGFSLNGAYLVCDELIYEEEVYNKMLSEANSETGIYIPFQQIDVLKDTSTDSNLKTNKMITISRKYVNWMAQFLYTKGYNTTNVKDKFRNFTRDSITRYNVKINSENLTDDIITAYDITRPFPLLYYTELSKLYRKIWKNDPYRYHLNNSLPVLTTAELNLSKFIIPAVFTNDDLDDDIENENIINGTSTINRSGNISIYIERSAPTTAAPNSPERVTLINYTAMLHIKGGQYNIID